MNPTCGWMQCENPAEFYGPLWSTLDHNETYPSFSCADHTEGMAIIRKIGHPITDQPPGYPVFTERT